MQSVSFPVGVGQKMGVQVQVDMKRGVTNFYFSNFSRNLFMDIVRPLPKNFKFSGRTVDFIVERPTVTLDRNSSYTMLANFHNVYIWWACWGSTRQSGLNAVTSANTTKLDMISVNGGIAMATPGSLTTTKGKGSFYVYLNHS